jgi:Bacterial Ig-like domain (group 1)
MCHFLSQLVLKARSSAFSRTANRPTLVRRVFLSLLVVCVASLSSSFAQPSFLTTRGDVARTGANTNETLLTPSNVNKAGFGKLFSTSVDYIVMAQPLYVPNVNIPGQGTHNVVYVVTQADSVYAIDADTGAQLWYASMLYGGTTASGKYLPCGPSGVGFSQEGIVGTPVIDPTTKTMYLVAKTLLNTTVRHHLHALDITTGNEQPGSPVLITATSTSKKGHVTNFNSLHQKNRPGLLLLNGVLYLAFGSNYCNDANTAWVLSYDAASLSQLGAFNASPDYGITSIWQTGNGLAADEAGNIFATTSECGGGGYDIPSGGQDYCMSALKLAPDDTLIDYFTPSNVAFLSSNDLDMTAGALVLPDQNGPYPHELISGGKYGVAYVLDRDNLGMYTPPPGTDNVIQEVALAPWTGIDLVMDSPAYWNNTVYFAPNGLPIMAFPLSDGLLGTPVKTSQKYPGSHSPSISANDNTNGILWALTSQLSAFDAVSLKLLYSSSQAPNGRDTLPPVGHFATQTVINGKVFVGTQTSLEAYGLFHVINITAGANQTATVATALPAIQVQVYNPYTGQPDVGATVNFSDGGKGGSFNPASAVTDSNGNASSVYTLPKKMGTYTLTMSGSGFSTVTTTATATPGPATKIVAYGGGKQTGAAGSNLANPLKVQAQDSYGNGISGITVNFTANHGAIPNPASAVTGATGLANTTLQLPTTVATITVTGSSSPFKNISFVEYSVAGSAANITITGGNNQTAPAGSQLPQALTVVVTDQYGNPVSGNNVTFDDGGAGGSFGANPAVTGSNGTATETYTLPSVPGTVTVNATAAGVSTPAVFTETGQ